MPPQHPEARRRPASVPLPNHQQPTVSLEQLLNLQTRLEVMDIGAACIAEEPVYKRHLDRGIAHLHAFDGDQRQIARIHEVYGSNATVYPYFLFDGSMQTVYLATGASGMTSLLEPKPEALKFFNGFENFGKVLEKKPLQTHRLDDIEGLGLIDFLKMDIQGAELTVLQNGREVLQQCVAIQLEVSYIALYKDQPTFGDVDVWMRSQGFVPHCFLAVKRWSIAPLVKNNNIRLPFNQLLESDIVYVRDPLTVAEWSDEQIRKLAIIASDCFGSPDLAVYLLRELIRRGRADAALQTRYLEHFSRPKP